MAVLPPRTEGIPEARAKEILRWLDRKVTADEAIAEIRRDEEHIQRVAIPKPLLVRFIWIAIGGFVVDLFWRIVDGPRRSGSDLFCDWVSRFDLSKLELWKYDTGGDSWEQLHGESGFAVVADGALVDFWMWSEN